MRNPQGRPTVSSRAVDHLIPAAPSAGPLRLVRPEADEFPEERVIQYIIARSLDVLISEIAPAVATGKVKTAQRALEVLRQVRAEYGDIEA